MSLILRIKVILFLKCYVNLVYIYLSAFLVTFTSHSVIGEALNLISETQGL